MNNNQSNDIYDIWGPPKKKKPNGLHQNVKAPNCACPDPNCPIHGNTKFAQSTNIVDDIKNAWRAYKNSNDSNRKTNMVNAVIPGFKIQEAYVNNLQRHAPAGHTVNDKFKHSYLSCYGAQPGLYSTAKVLGAGAAKEIGQQINGSNTRSESIDDMKANMYGASVGYNNPTGDCNSLVQDRYKMFIKR